jgi:hypothetical protein
VTRNGHSNGKAHERVGTLGAIRARLRSAFFGLLRKVATTDDAKAIQVESLQNLLPPRAHVGEADEFGLGSDDQPYADLGRRPEQRSTAHRDDIVIISARFRSGSTLLWNLFRALPGCTAYYEPFNERRWFDPGVRGDRTDPTHRGVGDYWREYDGLTELGEHYREDWIRQNLLMDAGSWDPAMKRYVEILVERAAGRPVLQFNRIDFRLPWFRQTFPNAKIIHLYRHPRDQWISSLVDPASCPKDASMTRFAGHDHYYLRMWACDLKYHFPFLDERTMNCPYRLFYFLWRLSYLYGRRYAHVSIAYEDVVSAPEQKLSELFGAVGITDFETPTLVRMVAKPRSNSWRAYADEQWFRGHESHCEAVLADFFRRS